ncbi:efflux RND transporter periplasmic adaptor subunit [Pseudaminobacter sp. NGMCC 1.201702]|uniref:efflux RND transporter periplasmic adaptor subunit n=1 Tax=Pseudaminobacter sp. NGMCC 1.201702 TaxID=3391825 RepID=UPI0039F072DF
MKHFFLGVVLLAGFTGVGAGAYWAGRQGVELPMVEAFLLEVAPYAFAKGNPAAEPAGPAPSGPIIYYRHPDGEPRYSAEPVRAEDGREFIPVRASADISFDDSAALETVAPPADGERRILYYRNPMGLPDTSPVPKKDSMGMDYIPVYKGEEEAGSTVKVSPGKLQRTGVKTGLATRAVITRPVRVPGQIEIDERRVNIVSTRTEAFVEEVSDVTTGDKVAEGEPLVRLYAKEIAAAGAQFLTDLKSGAGGDAMKGSRQRLINLGVPAEAIAEIEQTRKVPITVTMTSPRNGVVLERAAVNGMMAAPGEALFRIADISSVWVLADVPEYELGSVTAGAKATVRVRSLQGTTFEGKVDLIYPQIDQQTRTTRVRIELANPDGLLLANMYAEVEIVAGSSEAVVAVPDSAVIDSGDRQVVIVDMGEGRFEPREVEVGKRGEGVTEIMEGVAEGERVVVSANFLIDAESNLKAALSALAPGETQP